MDNFGIIICSFQSAGSPGLCLVLWGVCGVYSLLGESILNEYYYSLLQKFIKPALTSFLKGAISYCEIGTLIPKSGGKIVLSSIF